MKNLKTALFTIAMIAMATMSSYAQSMAESKTEKFIFLFRGEDMHIQTANYELKEVKDYIQLWITWQQGLAQKGILVGGDPLQNLGKVVNGKSKVVTDGAVLASGQTVDGYLIVNAKDINEAVEIAKGCPLLTKEMEK